MSSRMSPYADRALPKPDSRRTVTQSAAPPVMPIKSLIAGYIDHLQEGAYVAAVFVEAPMAEIDRLLASMLRSGNREEVGHANLFMQDAVMFGFSPEFARYLPRSSALRALRENIRAEDYFSRHQSLHTLSRIGPRSNAQYLAAEFSWYLEHDPLNLDDLLGELFWLKHRTVREPYVEAMISAPLYLARWAVMHHLLDHGSYTEQGRLLRLAYLRRLAQDSHERVRAEAIWNLHQLQVANESRLDPDRPIGEDGSHEPRLMFFSLVLHVSNYLFISGRRDYDFSLVERIAAYVEEHPMYPGIDIRVYWATFAEFEH